MAHRLPGNLTAGDLQITLATVDTTPGSAKASAEWTVASVAGAVAFDAAKAAVARNADVLILDTAGRLHTKVNLMEELKENYTIIVVTHNMQQAARVSDYTAFFNLGENRAGILEEYGATNKLFTNPAKKTTEDYITGRFG